MTLTLASWTTGLLAVFFTLVSALMMLVILVQKPKGGGLSGAFGGAGGGSANAAFGAKVGDVLTWSTVVLFVCFVGLAIALVKTIDTEVESSTAPPTTTTTTTTTTGAGQGDADAQGDGDPGSADTADAAVENESRPDQATPPSTDGENPTGPSIGSEIGQETAESTSGESQAESGAYSQMRGTAGDAGVGAQNNPQASDQPSPADQADQPSPPTE